MSVLKNTVIIVMMRHGESEWNLENKFCGWYDAKLTEKGKFEALEAGKLLKQRGYTFDIAFCSLLERSINTCQIVLKEMNLINKIKTKSNWHLNEKHYGFLTGLDKIEIKKIWRKTI